MDRDEDGIPDAQDKYPDDPENLPPGTTLTILCYMDSSFTDQESFTVATDRQGRPDFTAMWAARAPSCEIEDAVAPTTDLEKTAYKTSGYTDGDIKELYVICAELDPADPYLAPGFAASADQIKELRAALVLCPRHPYAAKWRQAIQRGISDAGLEAEGKLFGAGTFLVGKEVKPGSYVAVNVEGCYWERQDKNGGTIDNQFVLNARRVQVTIRPGDYAFSSSGCGEWRPAS